MTKKKQVGVRFDSNRTRLKTGETQRPNGTYAYRWSTPDGKRHSIYAPTLEKLREQRMPRINRAASFSPFAALTGYDDQVKEAGRLTDERIELDDGTISTLNDKRWPFLLIYISHKRTSEGFAIGQIATKRI